LDLEVTPPPSDEEQRAIAAALGEGERLPAAYTSRWRAAALDELGDDALPQERGGDAGVVQP
jgi:hypothetical protein